MLLRGSHRRALVVVLFGVLIVALTVVAANSSSTFVPATTASTTLTLALPGPFEGCGALDSATNDSTRAVLDLTRPSAFLTSSANQLTGEGGAIVSAELTSLKPETVVYTIDAKLKWSNGLAFRASDLISWWHAGVSDASVLGDGYRAIRSMNTSTDGVHVTAVFKDQTPFADWNLLFRDVEQAGTTPSCAVASLAERPSLGPYLVVSATASRVVLRANPAWPLNYNRFQRISLIVSDASHAHGSFFVDYTPVVSSSDINAVGHYIDYFTGFVSSPELIEATFSPHAKAVSAIDIRAGLSWLINRAAIARDYDNFVTATSVEPSSALLSLSSPDYPVPIDHFRPTVANVSLVNPSQECSSCALTLLRLGGLHLIDGRWRDSNGLWSVSVAVGPSALDATMAREVLSKWRSVKIAATEHIVSSDELAAQLVSRGLDDVAVFTRPVGTNPWTTARSWFGSPFLDAYPSGVTSASLNQEATIASATFNPSTALTSWLKIDTYIQTNFWVRPLVDPPSLTVWAGRVGNVEPSSSLPGLVDQAPNWGVAPPNSLPTTTTTLHNG